MENKITIRKINSKEIPRLEQFLFDAIFIPEGYEKPDRSIIKIPELNTYIKDFGKKTDICFVAELKGALIGAIWARIFPVTEKGFGFIDSQTPELSMSVNENYRKQGIGTNLLMKMIDRLKQLHYKQVSLSVDKLNYAFKMYQGFGFEEVKSDEKSATMVKKLK